VDREGLWFKVLVSRYGEERGRLREGGRGGSSWWRDIVRIHDGWDVEGGSWFEESIQKKVGNYVTTFFWTDKWMGPVLSRKGLGSYMTCTLKRM